MNNFYIERFYTKMDGPGIETKIAVGTIDGVDFSYARTVFDDTQIPLSMPGLFVSEAINAFAHQTEKML